MAKAQRTIVYPESDGKPMAESDTHRIVLCDSIGTLEDFVADDPCVYVSGNLLLYYEEGNPRKRTSPDVLVKKKSRKGARRNYLVWEEGGAPEVVIEVSSCKTRREDLRTKFQLYQDVLRVKEYFLIDPLEDYLQPPLQGFQLRGGKYVPIPEVDGRLPSMVLGLHLKKEGECLRFFNPPTGQYLLTRAEGEAEERAGRRHERAARLKAEREKQQAEAEVERLRRELDALRQRRGVE